MLNFKLCLYLKLFGFMISLYLLLYLSYNGLPLRLGVESLSGILLYTALEAADHNCPALVRLGHLRGVRVPPHSERVCPLVQLITNHLLLAT